MKLRPRLVLCQCRPQRTYAIFRFLMTVFLLFRRRQRWLVWRPLDPEALVATIRTLGTSFLKLAQVLATRADFFDANYLAALRQLHDQMPAMPPAQCAAVFAAAFPKPEVFTTFDTTPIASASIGQVHRAVLRDGGHEVAVKLRRQDIRTVVQIDIMLLRVFLLLFRPLFSSQTRNSIEAVLRAFTEVILQEVSMEHELANLQQFSEEYATSGICFPRPYPEYCSDAALVMSFESGVRIDDTAAVAQLEVEFSALMEQLVLFYTEQMLVKGFFHADPHPGNLLVNAAGQLVLLDFGMVSRIPHHIRQAMIQAVKAAYEHDYELLVGAVRRLGILTEEADLQGVSAITEELFGIFSSEHLDATNMQDLAFGVLDLLHDQPFKLPQDVIYVMRVSSLLEGLGTQYVPNFNGVKDILPILKQNLTRALGEENCGIDALKREARQFPLTLVRARRVIEQAEQGDLAVRISPADRNYMVTKIGCYLRSMCWLLFWFGLALFLQRYEGVAATRGSLVCVGGAVVVMLNLLRRD
ncbi:MAG: AarF/UbiB family protein [Desulfuromonadaceae bacterium]|nr:AarF/UbiB family protein [Desulfuromonadaceae bacterium]